MSRGGRFGGGAGRGGGQNLPFDIDPALESEIAALRERDEKPINDKSRLYPPMKIPYAPPPTAREEEEIQIWREMMAQRRASLAFRFCDDLDGGNHLPAHFDAFEDVNSHLNAQKSQKRKRNGLPDIRKLKINWELMPAELQELQYPSDDEETKRKKRRAALAKKAKDRISKIRENDDGDDDGPEKVDADEDEENANEDGVHDDDIDELQDDDFEEDEEDAAGDYNAEQFFDNGEDDGDMDDGGGDDL